MDETELMPNEQELTETAPEAPDPGAELEELRTRLEKAERRADQVYAGWREFTELFPDADLSSMPDSFNAALERGIPPAAAYALELRRREVTRLRMEAAAKRSRELSSGRINNADDTLYSPEEVRAMTPSEVKENYQKIRRSMKSWR